MKFSFAFLFYLLGTSFAFSQAEILELEKPTKEIILKALTGFNWDNNSRANKDEALRILKWIGAEYQHDNIGENGNGFVCGEFQSGYHITFWTDTYGNNDRYGVRFGILDARHSFFASNDTYFEIIKTYNPFYPNRKENRPPTVHLVAVGISKYKQDFEFNPLEFTVAGAYSIRNLFERRNLTVPGKPIIESSARRLEILSKLRGLTDPANVLEDDMVIFYFSGHGLMAGGKVGICPHDYQSPADLITDDSIVAILSRSPARHKVCLIEACKDENSAAYIDPNMVAEFNRQRLNISPGIVFITSTEVGRKSWGGTEGYFTQAIMEALDEGKADTNKDKIVTAQELFEYIQPAVKKQTKDQQIPQINSKYPKNLPLMRLEN